MSPVETSLQDDANGYQNDAECRQSRHDAHHSFRGFQRHMHTLWLSRCSQLLQLAAKRRFLPLVEVDEAFIPQRDRRVAPAT
jgi:hypothetical protein